jgi:hypothetical protein
MNKYNNLPSGDLVEAQRKFEWSCATENQKIPNSNLKSQGFGGVALAGTDSEVNDSGKYLDYRNKFNKCPSVEEVLKVGKLIEGLRNDKVNAGL